ncbi:MAG TPA: hypothetical protein PLN32_06945 [Methanoregulaceae archaeon]|jgi:hypothetical protein|nr:hypothetical protein [Methanoregulaceae archaeon]
MRKIRAIREEEENGSYTNCCQGEVHHWDDDGSNYSGAYKYPDEPVQGCAKDCFFIAALKAVAYKANDRLLPETDNFRFLNTETMTVETITLNDRNLAYTSDNRLVYAKGRSGFLWPMLYEKAYAMWLNSKKSPANQHWDAIDKTQPDIEAIFADGGGNGITAIMQITHYRDVHEKPSNTTMNSEAFEDGIPLYPTVVATKNIPAPQLALPDRLIPQHTYMIDSADQQYYFLINPCDPTNTNLRLYRSRLTDVKFATWGYVRP